MIKSSELFDQGEQSTVDGLVLMMKRYGPEVRRRITHRIPRRFQSFFDADDVMQETYSQAFEAFVYHPPAQFASWLHRAAENNLKDLIRYCEAKKRNGGIQPVLTGEFDIAMVGLGELALSHLTSPTSHARRSEVMRVVREQIESLPERSRRVIVLYDLLQWPIEKVARELGCSIGAAYMRRRSAMNMLRGRLESFYRSM